jgi:hypothetical protein
MIVSTGMKLLLAVCLLLTSRLNKLRVLFIRKQEIYTMLWKLMDLSKYMIAGAPYGGPIGRPNMIAHYF